MHRRRFLTAIPLLLCMLPAPGCGRLTRRTSFTNAIAELEKLSGGRLGVALVFPNGQSLGFRQHERFGFCSTFKTVLAAIVLRDIDTGRLQANQLVSFTPADMVSYAPVTSQFLATGQMTVLQLARAAQETSDNVATNLLLRLIGGPREFTQRLRALGDDTTRLDRYEPELNLVPPGETRDTTTALAAATTVQRVLNGNYLTTASRAQLKQWMVNATTGQDRLRAGLPSEWTCGDKTGTGIAPSMPTKYNDVAAIWPREPLQASVLCAFFDAPAPYNQFRKADEAVLKDVGAIAARFFPESA